MVEQADLNAVHVSAELQTPMLYLRRDTGEAVVRMTTILVNRPVRNGIRFAGAVSPA